VQEPQHRKVRARTHVSHAPCLLAAASRCRCWCIKCVPRVPCARASAHAPRHMRGRGDIWTWTYGHGHVATWPTYRLSLIAYYSIAHGAWRMADHGYGDGTSLGPPWLAGRPHSRPTVWRLLWLWAVCVRASRTSQVLLPACVGGACRLVGVACGALAFMMWL